MSVKSPPKPRKTPRQSRSKALVDALRIACLKILDRDGPSGLTIAQIEAESGVGSGSFYEYFPNIDALVAFAFEELLISQMHISIREIVAEMHQYKSLNDAVENLVRLTLAERNRLYALYPQLYIEHIEYFEITREDEPYMMESESISILKQIFSEFEGETNTDDIEPGIFLFLEGIKLLTRSVYLKQPQEAHNEAMIRTLSAMLTAAIRH